MPERPPKEWFKKMVARLKKQYKGRSERDLQRIAAGIWHHQYSPTIKKKLTRKYEQRKRRRMK